jgi:hypothetical protein
MKDLVNNKLLDYADLHICLSGDKEDIEEAENEISKIIKPYLSKTEFTRTYENLFEYPGIEKLHSEAVKHPDKIFLYFHSKGMVFHENSKSRISEELVLFKNVIDKWEEVINIFNNKDINKVTFGCSKNGLGYYNFFWIRGKFLTKCKSPKKTDDRYYYEDYLSKECNKNNLDECYSLVSNSTQSYDNPEICSIMNNYVSNLL